MSLVVLLYTTLAVVNAVDYTGQCPKGCTCGVSSSHITVDCGQRFSDPERLLQQLNSLLSKNHFPELLVSLTIKNTPLTRIPASVCRLLNLKIFHFEHNNNITKLPDNCFNNLTKIVTVSIRFNSIASLQDGLFDDLQNLVTLDLSFNQIASIGLRVFSNASDLTSLRSLDLSFNRLTSLEPWWYYRCIQGNENSLVTIELNHNMISNFTNELQFNFDCGQKRPFGNLGLSRNQIAHVMDIFNGWNLASYLQVFCIKNNLHGHPYMKFYIGGYTYDCDCIDFDIYIVVKTAPRMTLLKDVYCKKTTTFSTGFGQGALATSIPLNQIVCDVTDRCPSSCRCAYRPDNSTLHVYCSSTNMTSLPLDLPPLPKTYVRYKLDFSNNKGLQRLERRPYFVNTSILDVSNCGLTEITIVVLKDISRFIAVDVRGNMLQSFPRHSGAVNISAKLLLGHNPWKCSCDNSWTIDWMNSLSELISDPGDIICKSPSRMYGKNVLKSTEDDFCVDPAQRTLIISVSVATAVLALVIILVVGGLLIYKLREQVYRRWRFHPFDRDECEGEDMEYDVFLCCSSLDNEPHGQQICRRLEERGYHVCYHERDFLPGQRIIDNMSQSVERTRRTVCLITDNFLQSPFCMTEFDMAYHHNVAEKRKKRLIVLMKLENPNDLYADDASDKATLRQFLRQYTYIDYTRDNWFDRLLYALPLQGLLQQRQAHDDDVQPLLDMQPAD